jgi:hypothetical protein
MRGVLLCLPFKKVIAETTRRGAVAVVSGRPCVWRTRRGSLISHRQSRAAQASEISTPDRHPERRSLPLESSREPIMPISDLSSKTAPPITSETVPPISPFCPTCGKEMRLTGINPTCDGTTYDYQCSNDGDPAKRFCTLSKTSRFNAEFCSVPANPLSYLRCAPFGTAHFRKFQTSGEPVILLSVRSRARRFGPAPISFLRARSEFVMDANTTSLTPI